MSAMPRRARWAIPVRVGLLGLPLLVGLVAAVRRAWVCDDIFISFRYVDHLTRGFGLVFNPGERVEGYTHFLWVVLLAVLHRLGFDLVTLGRFLPIVAWAALLGVLFVRAVRTSRSAGPEVWLALPVAAWGVALHHDARIFASSGLETSLSALLLLIGSLLVVARRPRLELAGVVYALAVLVRPEGLLYTGIAGAYVVWRWRAVRPVARFAVPWIALVLPYAIWKIVYYGGLMPNTYYAKSAGHAYWSQGWIYTRMYFQVYFVLIGCGLVALALWLAATLRGARSAPAGDARLAGTLPEAAARLDPRLDLVLLALVQVLLTVLYVTRVGGDFMFARFFIPVTPLLYLAAEEMVRFTGRRRAMAALAVGVVALTIAARVPRQRLFGGGQEVRGIADEESFYTPSLLQGLRHQGSVLERALSGTDARVLLPAGRSMVGYFGRLPYAVEGAGLTSAEIARQPLAHRGRPGHEKPPSDAWLQQHRIHFRLSYSLGRTTRLRPYERVAFDDVYCQMLFYDAALMDVLRKRPGVSCVDFRAYLDAYVQSPLRNLPATRLRDDYARFQRFYFQLDPDPERLAKLRAALLAAGLSPPDLRAPSISRRDS